jgi:5-hydroxyisourate hydrolase-like protein (transthyretin family)
MEINRLAANKALKALSDYHTFEDGGVDQPFLNADTVKDEEYE